MLKDLGVKGGALVLQEQESAATLQNENNDAADQPAAVGSSGKLIRRIVDADNSCLFNSFGYCLLGKTRQKSQVIRKIVSDELARQQDIYTEAFLNKSNADYRKWILDPNAWGGAIEIAILSQYYKVEVGVFDIQTTRMDLYGEGNHYNKRIYLLYDGIHYDPMALAPSGSESGPESADVTQFNPSDPTPKTTGQSYCQALHAAHQYTDTSKFALRCLVCGKGLEGEQAAMKHAQETKPPHTNFSEYSK